MMFVWAKQRVACPMLLQHAPTQPIVCRVIGSSTFNMQIQQRSLGRPVLGRCDMQLPDL
jgi:hypothetical protein